LTKTCYFLDRNITHKIKKSNREYVHDLQLETRTTGNKHNPFVRLLGGDEPLNSVDARWKLYNESWLVQQEKIDRLLESTNEQVLDSISDFILEPWYSDPDARLATAIILPGSNIANHLRLFSQIHQRIAQQERCFQVTIGSKECINLKVALKLIVGRLTEADEDGKQLDIEEDDIRFDRRLRYDLDILADWCKKKARPKQNGIKSVSDMRIVVCVEDADSFDISMLAGLIKQMQSYISQIPFKLMLSVATSLEVFEEKLTRSCIRLIAGRAFHAQMTEGIDKILDAIMFTYHKTTLLLGPNLFDSLVHRQRRSLESVDTFISSLKYIFMAHYYSNPFSIFSQCGEEGENGTMSEDIQKFLAPVHIRALRMLPSFRRMVEGKLDLDDKSEALKLLQDDDYLKSIIPMSLVEFRDYVLRALSCIDILLTLQGSLDLKEATKSKMDLYSVALSGDLLNDPFLSWLLSKARNSNHEQLSTIIRDMGNLVPTNEVARDIHYEFTNKYNIDDLANDRPTYVTAAAGFVVEIIETILRDSLISYKSFFLYEAFVSDSATLQENSLLPTYRAAIELALSEPDHYWGSTTQSPTHLSVLYQLYRESSVFINLFDYFGAFKELTPRPAEDKDISEEQWELKVLAWFLQGIAELKFLGLVRDSKRKFECVEKIVWKGL
jgi:origin recognition complex subunit 3